jgi:MinD superfamily P-loop ATPase
VIASLSGADALLAVTEPSLSGVHDLRRLVELARQFRIPVKVALNKADLSLEAAERVRAACLEEGLELIGELPFDERLPAALERMAAEDGAGPGLDDSPGVQAARSLWERLQSWMAGWPERRDSVLQITRVSAPAAEPPPSR